MSTTLDGSIEVYLESSDSWVFIMDTFGLFYQDYNIFAALFGVRNYIDIEPIAAYRGIPEDITKQSKRIIAGNVDNFDHSYITYDELINISDELKTRKILSIQCNAKGKISQNGFISRNRIDYKDSDILSDNQGQKIIKLENENVGIRYFINRVVSLNEILESNYEFKILLKIMDLLSSKYDKDKIRWLVGFTI